ncbi:MAG: T9SS type A sorting domain-containing protein, partial [Microscillaceae bacterium]|nr:T9SS type A sorting domain-containing protein [Microscillaceae bacterium]
VTDSDNNGSQAVSLNGAASTDADGTIVSYVWTENGAQIATGVSPSVTLSVGTHTITLTVADDDGVIDTDEVIVTVNAPASGNEPTIQSLTFVDATGTDTELLTISTSGISQIFTLTPTAKLATRANTSGNVASVGFVLTGPGINFSKTENIAPYTIFGDLAPINPNDLNPYLGNSTGVLPAGAYTLAVTAYSGANLGGTKGSTFTVNFTISYSAAKGEQAATSAEDLNIDQEPALLVNAYPVPMDNRQELHLEFSRAIQGKVSFTLVSLSGSVLDNQNLDLGNTTKELTIKFGHLTMAQGTYYLKIQGDELKATQVRVLK